MAKAFDSRSAGADTAARRLLPDPGANARLNKLAKLAARIVNAENAEISLHADEQTIVGAGGVTDETPPPTCDESLLAQTMNAGETAVIADARADEQVHDVPAVVTGHVGAYLSVPLRTEEGALVGAVCAYDAEPHEWEPSDAEHLEAVAGAVAAELELAALSREIDAERSRWYPAIEAAGVGCFDWNLRTGQLQWDDALVRMFGYNDDDRFDESIESFNSRVHGDDLPRVTHALERAIGTLGDYEIEFRALLPNGDERRLQARGRAYGDAEGRPLHLLGAAWDVSVTRDRAREAELVIEAMPVGFLTVDHDWNVVSLNSAGEQLLQVRRSELVGQSLWDALPETVGTDFERLYRRVFASQTCETFEAFYPAPVSAWLEMRVVAHQQGLAMYMTDVTDRHNAQEAAAAIAARDRSTAVALQEAMLTKLPQRDHLEIKTRYITAAADHQVGGDWYDAIIQSSGALIAVVGDVGGHDITAATVMGQLRTMLRAFAWDGGQSPASALSRLDQAMHDLEFHTLATCVAARIEQTAQQRGPDTCTVRWTNAGNMPPLVIEPDGHVQVLERRSELLLGIDPTSPRTDHTMTLPPGSTLVLYTDGLVETRADDLDARLATLVEAASELGKASVDDLLDGLVSRMVGARPEDDVVVLALRMRPHD